MESFYNKSEIPDELQQYFCPVEIGLEETPEQFVAKLVDVFRELKRVLKDDGTLWLNLGDSYSGSGDGGGTKSLLRENNAVRFTGRDTSKPKQLGLKPKDLIGIPWMVAFALRSDGWYLRQDIIWHKPNPMPESVTDRCTKSHEYIFLLSKSAKYYYDQDAIKTEIIEDKGPQTFGGKKSRDAQSTGGDPRNGHRSDKNSQWGKVWQPKAYAHRGEGDKKLTGHSGNYDKDGNLIGNGMANKKSVWTVTTKPYSEAHFATYPPDLIVDCIKAGCPEGGIVLDPFMGAGTTALVARKLNRNYIGFELNPEYIRIAKNRLQSHLGLFV